MNNVEDFVYPNRWLIAIAACAGSVMATMDTFVLFVSGPYLRGVFSASVSEISWLTTSYATSSLVFMLLSGFAVQALGQKKAFIAALCTFLLGSFLCAVSESLESLVFSRLVQGAGAGVMLPVEIVILRNIFPPKKHALIMGLYGTTVMSGPAFGPILGGIIIDSFHWSLIFLINIPIGIFSLGLIIRYLKQDDGEREAVKKEIDWIGIIFLVLGIFTLILLLERGDRTYWFDTRENHFLLFIAMFSLSMFVAHELKTNRPSVDFSVLCSPAFASAAFLIFSLSFVVSSTLFILPIFMQELLGFSPTEAGTSMAPRALVMAIIFPLSGWALGWVNPKPLILSGLFLGMVASALMSKFTHESGWHDIIIPQIILGVGIALVLTPLNAVALTYVPNDKLAAASAFEATSSQLGSTFGITISAALYSHLEKANWAILRHNISFSNTVLYKRFAGVVEYFRDSTASRYESVEKAFRALNGRVTEQILSLTFMHMFQLAALAFLAMLIVAAMAKLSPKSP